MKRLAIAVALCVLALPGVALADDGPASAAQQAPAQLCSAQRTALGAQAFGALYGTNANKANAFGKCVAKQQSQAEQNTTTGSARCRAEQSDPSFAASHGGKTFEQAYGTNPSGKNAFGKCVAQHAQALTASQQAATISAARSCRTEQAADAAAFRAKYGTNANKANAFGKCVAAHAASS